MNRIASLALSLPLLATAAGAANANAAITLQTEAFRYVIRADGVNQSFVDRSTGTDYLDASSPSRFMTIARDGRTFGATALDRKGDLLFVEFGDSGVTAMVRQQTKRRYLTLELISLKGGPVSIVGLTALPLKLTQQVSHGLASCRNQRYAAAVIPLNLETHSSAAAVGQSAVLTAEADARVRLVGAKIALLGSPAADLLPEIERVELENGLPHPTLQGTWARKSPELAKSYLFVDLSASTADSVIRYAKAGNFGYVVVYDGVWNAASGSYLVNLRNFPDGESGLRAVSDKLHAAGLKFGMHNLDMVVSKDNPLVHPIPATGFMMYPANRRTLAAGIGPSDSFIPTTESPAGLLGKSDKSRFQGRDLRVGDEIITYDDLRTAPPYGFVGCTRGAHGTVAASHPAASSIDNFSEFIGYYRPDVKSGLYDRVARAEADSLERFRFDFVYPDGTGENLGSWPDQPLWYATNLLTAKWFRSIRSEAILAHGPISDYSWHVFSRGNTTDNVHIGVIEHFDRVSLAGARESERDLQPFELGWLGYFDQSLDGPATRPREIEYAWAKALALDAAMSLETTKASLDGNGRTGEILALMARWEDLKLRHYFPQTVREQLKAPGKEFALRQNRKHGWEVVPVLYSPARYVKGQDSWAFDNPYSEQSPRITIEARPKLAEYGAPDNKILLRPGPVDLYTSGTGPLGRSERQTPGLVFNLQPGTDDFSVSAENHGSAPLGWGCAEVVLGSPVDLSRNRALGTWVYGDGSNALLHFVIEDSGRWAVRDYYVRLDFRGWKYVQIAQPAQGEVYDFAFPYSNYWALAGINLRAIARVYVFLTNVKPGTAVHARFRRLEALHESALPLRNPALEWNGELVTFPVSIQPDGYLEYDGAGRARVFNANGFLQSDLAIPASPRLKRGANLVRAAISPTGNSGDTAEITVAVRGEPLH